jgi:hypothetical protein
MLNVVPVSAALAAQATGFIPGEWRITTVTQGPLIGSRSTTAEVCLRGLGQASATPGDGAQIAVPGEAGAVHNTITQDGGQTILQSHYSVHNTLPGTGPTMVESYTGRDVYQHDPLHRSVMTGTGKLTSTQQGKVVMQYTVSKHGYWLSPGCLAHPPKPVTQTLAPSPAMQRLLAKNRKAEQQVQSQSAELGPAQAAVQRLQAQQKLMAPLEQESRQALKDHDMPKFLKLQAQIQAIEKSTTTPPAPHPEQAAHP